MQSFDIVIIGAGAAGLMCAGIAGRRGARVALIEHSDRRAEKIRISGGGRCNFTNLQADRPERFVSTAPGFAGDTLRAYPPGRFIELVRSHGIDYHEKHRGQLFCDESSERIIAMLYGECATGRVTVMQPCAFAALRPGGPAGFEVDTSAGTLAARHVVIATGGLSIPKLGATDLGYRIARQFGLGIVEPRPGLVPFTFDSRTWASFVELAGLALQVDVTVAPADQTPGAPRFHEDLLITHRGLSGPAALQISSYWRPGDALRIDLAAGRDLSSELKTIRERSRQQVETVLGSLLPKRLAGNWLAQSRHAGLVGRKFAELGNRQLLDLAADIQGWTVTPDGTEGFRKAEVTVGGVATVELDPRSLAAHKMPGLHFIGEVVDVTGWLGGYNFQWAWASAYQAATSMT